MSAGRGAARHRIAAVIVREMRALARYRTPFVLRTVYGALVAAPVAVFFAEIGDQARWSGEHLAYFGFQSFTMLVWFQSFLALVLGILMGVVSVATERRERTLGLVMLSQVRPAELVLGKLTALVVLLSTVLLAGLPVYALVGWAGGLDYFWFACLVLLSLALAVLGIAAGLAGGLLIKNGFGAVLWAATLLFLPMILGTIWEESVSSAHRDPLVRLLASAAWLTRTVARQDGDDPGWATVDAVMLSVVIAAFLLYAVRILPRAASAREGSGLRGAFEKLDRFYEGINLGGIRFGRERRSLAGDPVSWLTRTTSGTALMRYGFRLGAAMVIVSLLSVPWLVLDEAQGLLWLLFGGGLITAMVTLGATSLGDEKARRSLSVLLATPLTAAQILHGKMRAALPVLLVTAVPVAFYLAFVQLTDPGGITEIVEGIVFVLAEGLCGYFLALHMSLHLASSLRAGIAAALTLAAVHVLFGWSASRTDDRVAVAVILVAVAVSVWAQSRGKPVARFAALLVALVTATGLLFEWLDQPELIDSMVTTFLFFFGLLVVVSVLSYLHARLIFDRVLGRTP